ncbi:nitroreductase [Luminiphilus syltensis NOR5-1B]|uniref:Nitroreductase n=1 Tax=Luminiphilus syltensis NOR5-1B TaxID=565045 RepID=B8KSB5_9GAMM|nr:nitroreductase [Luminiphilus syltensis]EED36704.1 nitroreductase [Luminiphilus syltensis NOR5-1B]
MDVITAIEGRQSIRDFDASRAVSDDLIKSMLGTAARAPSGSNIQPWHVYVVRDELQRKITDACVERFLSGDEGEAEYHYYPRSWRQPYIGRRRETGFGLYGLLGIDKSDKAAVQGYRIRNYQFFGAPVGFFFTIDRDMEPGSWLDYGMFLQSLMLTARARGLETCAQAAFCPYHDSITPLINAPEQEMLVCGMSMGYPVAGSLINTYRTSRLTADAFTHFPS